MDNWSIQSYLIFVAAVLAAVVIMFFANFTFRHFSKRRLEHLRTSLLAESQDLLTKDWESPSLV